MTHISYHASHEQFTPSELIRYAVLAEQCGFHSCHSSDHFHPWSKRQGQSGFAFAWLGAAMQATAFPFSIITAPGQRYHPAITAQAIATLLEMFPERLEVALGSGEALNERITGEPWPKKVQRNARLQQCADIICRLLKGETVNHKGLIEVHEAHLYTRPARAPKLMCAALSAETARWCGQWAEGLLTVHKPEDELSAIIQAFRSGGGEGKPVHVQMALSYSPDETAALEGAYDQWRCNVLDPKALSDVYRVEQFDALAEAITPDIIRDKIPVSSNPEVFTSLIQQDITLGADIVILHNVNKDQETFIRDFGKWVLPAFSK